MCCFFAFAQSAAQPAVGSGIEFSDSAAADGEQFGEGASPGATPADYPKTSTAWQFVKIILVLILVIACIYGIVWLLKKAANPRMLPDPYLKRVAALSLAPGKAVYVVSTPTQAFVVGATDNSVNLIGEITDKELIDMMNLNADNASGEKPKDFATIISSFVGGFAKKEPQGQSFGEYLTGAGAETAERFREKREQIQRESQPEDFR